MGRKRKLKQQRKLEKQSQTSAVEGKHRDWLERKPGVSFPDSIPESDVKALFPELGDYAPSFRVGDLPGTQNLPKASEQLESFAQPLFNAYKGEETPENVKRIFQIAMANWNSLRLPDNEELQFSVMAAKGMAKFLGINPAAIDEMLYERAKFSDDPRIMVDVNIIDTGGELRVLVATTLSKSIK